MGVHKAMRISYWRYVGKSADSTEGFWILKEGLTPSWMVFHALVNFCCKLQKYGEAVKVLEDLIRFGHPPRYEYCKMLVSKLYYGGEKERVESVIQNLLRCGFYDDEIA